MLVEKITSRQNPLVKRFKRVRASGERHLVFLEGIRLLEDALKAGAHFESIAFTSSLESTDRGLDLLDELQHIQCRGAHVSKQVMQAISDTESSQGVAALVSRPQYDLEDLLSADPQIIVIADELQDPGNLGTIVRTAEAAGASGMITTRDTVDPYNQKAMRASMGAGLRLPITTGTRREEAFEQCRRRGLKLIASRPAYEKSITLADPSAAVEKIYSDADFTIPLAFVLGSEAGGISDETAQAADVIVHIPMAPGVESLNVAAAAAVLLYEAARQRDFRFQSSNS